MRAGFCLEKHASNPAYSFTTTHATAQQQTMNSLPNRQALLTVVQLGTAQSHSAGDQREYQKAVRFVLLVNAFMARLNLPDVPTANAHQLRAAIITILGVGGPKYLNDPRTDVFHSAVNHLLSAGLVTQLEDRGTHMDTTNDDDFCVDFLNEAAFNGDGVTETDEISPVRDGHLIDGFQPIMPVAIAGTLPQPIMPTVVPAVPIAGDAPQPITPTVVPAKPIGGDAPHPIMPTVVPAKPIGGDAPHPITPTVVPAGPIAGDAPQPIMPTVVRVVPIAGDAPQPITPTVVPAVPIAGDAPHPIMPTVVPAVPIAGDAPQPITPTVVPAGPIAGDAPHPIMPTVVRAGPIAGDAPQPITPTVVRAGSIGGDAPQPITPTVVPAKPIGGDAPQPITPTVVRAVPIAGDAPQPIMPTVVPAVPIAGDAPQPITPTVVPAVLIAGAGAQLAAPPPESVSNTTAQSMAPVAINSSFLPVPEATTAPAFHIGADGINGTVDSFTAFLNEALSGMPLNLSYPSLNEPQGAAMVSGPFLQTGMGDVTSSARSSLHWNWQRPDSTTAIPTIAPMTTTNTSFGAQTRIPAWPQANEAVANVLTGVATGPGAPSNSLGTTPGFAFVNGPWSSAPLPGSNNAEKIAGLNQLLKHQVRALAEIQNLIHAYEADEQSDSSMSECPGSSDVNIIANSSFGSSTTGTHDASSSESDSSFPWSSQKAQTSVISSGSSPDFKVVSRKPGFNAITKRRKARQFKDAYHWTTSAVTRVKKPAFALTTLHTASSFGGEKVASSPQAMNATSSPVTTTIDHAAVVAMTANVGPSTTTPRASVTIPSVTTSALQVRASVPASMLTTSPHADGLKHRALGLLLQEYTAGVGVRRLLTVLRKFSAKWPENSTQRLMLEEYVDSYEGRAAAERIIDDASEFVNFDVRKSPSANEKNGEFDQVYLLDHKRPYFSVRQAAKKWHPNLGLTTASAIEAPTLLSPTS
ncbi:hypothetical protein OC834_006024 [Tilletia horrida]|nr:hypothetical protein OC834_006024 [Tilletia horrida]